MKKTISMISASFCALCSFGMVIHFIYLEWLVTRQNFWAIFNPLKLITVIITMFQTTTFWFLLISGVIFYGIGEAFFTWDEKTKEREKAKQQTRIN